MTDRITLLAERLTALEDRQQIADLIAGYGPAVDSLDGAGAAAIWDRDGRYEIGSQWALDGQAQIAGLTEFDQHRGYVEQGVGHVLSPHKITVTGDRATAHGYSMVVLKDPAGGWRIDRLSANRWVFERTAEGWRARSRRAELLDGQAAAQALLGWSQEKDIADD
ncbi:nuclear transport factor 2 family protein [Oceanicola sp. S124]|uniref:nuclear transport factor 2 family protein n=1 Tax=Oceanicola sp. S124 TaxID=1042378 RepID=UPI0002559CE0|nr:nuclear transport factor 2 family protein [Oceanicola sp. S124]